MKMTNGECQNATREHIENIRNFLDVIIIELIRRAENHDKSKLEEPELSVFMEYTSKLAKSTYGSDEYKQFLKEMQPALEHHYSNNRHHPEYFKEFGEMNLIDLIEMLLDWKAAT